RRSAGCVAHLQIHFHLDELHISGDRHAAEEAASSSGGLELRRRRLFTPLLRAERIGPDISRDRTGGRRRVEAAIEHRVGTVDERARVGRPGRQNRDRIRIVFRFALRRRQRRDRETRRQRRNRRRARTHGRGGRWRGGRRR